MNADMEKDNTKPAVAMAIMDDTIELGDGVIVNASGHVQELDRNFGLLSIASVGLVTGSEWPALGGSLLVAIFNGGPPGVIYEYLVVNLYYSFIAASIAELASAIPSSAGVYHWATVTAGPRYGKVVGWYAGWWNCLAWILGATAISSVAANMVVSMWALFHTDYIFERWHLFIAYLVLTWIGCLLVCFANRALPMISTFGLLFVLGGVFVTILVCAIMPSVTGSGYASNSFVWTDWENQTGYTSNGLVFLAGMLNGAFAVGTPDCTSHLSEEIPNPRVNVPKAIMAQMLGGFLTAFLFLIAIFYSIHDLGEVLQTTVPFPLAAIYQQATNSRGGAFGLLLVIFLPIFSCVIGVYITCGRMLWTLARDEAVPFSGFVGKVHPSFRNPFNATIICGIIVTVLGCIYVGSSTAFNAFVGSFVVLSTLSYVAAILPNVINRRRYLKLGPFNLGSWGLLVNILASATIILFIIIFCFPYFLPVDAKSMNYTCLITGGFTAFLTVWYLWKRSHGYIGPKVLLDEVKQLSEEIKS